MAAGFLRGGVSGFLKSSGGVTAGGHKETRIGIALVSIFLKFIFKKIFIRVMSK